MVFAPQCTLEPVLILCVVGHFSLFTKCEEAPTFFYPGLIVGEISHEQGCTVWTVWVMWVSSLFDLKSCPNICNKRGV